MGYKPTSVEKCKNFYSFLLPNSGKLYQKRYDTKAGSFTIALVVLSTDGSHLPSSYVIDRPDELKGLAIPHVGTLNYLCYADADRSDWEPFDKVVLASSIDKKIQETLDKALEDDEGEYRGDFVNYWDGQYDAYSFLSRPIKTSERWFFLGLESNLGNCQSKEFVFYIEESQKNDWISLRKDAKERASGKGVCVKVNNSKISPQIWPPKSLNELLDWLEIADKSAHDALSFKLTELGKKVIVLLDIEYEGLVAFAIEFQQSFMDVFYHSGAPRKRSRMKLKNLLPIIRSSNHQRSFFRINVMELNDKSLFLRNRPNDNTLIDKRICVLGCGTIGGYVTELLTKAGAGKGKRGLIEIFDRDIYKPDNFGRHCLPANYFGWNKAIALEDYLKTKGVGCTNIKSVEFNFKVDAKNAFNYDVIIDVTGKPIIGKLLARKVRCLNKSSKRPVIIHAYNDGDGRGSVAFADSGNACFGCLGKMSLFDSFERREGYSCGSIYTPYDASVSIITSGLVQELVLESLSDSPKWNYVEHINEGPRTRKKKLISPYNECKVSNHD